METHPFDPFLPPDAKILFLGTFPPQPKRWSMDFYYPNYINDFWRIMGIIFYDTKEHFCIIKEKRFDKEKITAFCKKNKIALFDSGHKVKRLKNNASDKFLDIIEPANITTLLYDIPQCNTIVTTGEKATLICSQLFSCTLPKIGEYTEFSFNSKIIKLYRMPSSSRAYPMKIEDKAKLYSKLF